MRLALGVNNKEQKFVSGYFAWIYKHSGNMFSLQSREWDGFSFKSENPSQTILHQISMHLSNIFSPQRIRRSAALGSIRRSAALSQTCRKDALGRICRSATYNANFWRNSWLLSNNCRRICPNMSKNVVKTVQNLFLQLSQKAASALGQVGPNLSWRCPEPNLSQHCTGLNLLQRCFGPNLS